MEVLLGRGLDPDTVDTVTSAPLWELAFRSGYQHVVSKFAAAGADLDRSDERGSTVLHRTVGAGPDAAPVLQLLDLGAEIDARDQFGWTALHVASAHGYADSVRVLLARGASRDLLTAHGKSALDFAVANRRADVVELLSERNPLGRADG